MRPLTPLAGVRHDINTAHYIYYELSPSRWKARLTQRGSGCFKPSLAGAHARGRPSSPKLTTWQTHLLIFLVLYEVTFRRNIVCMLEMIQS